MSLNSEKQPLWSKMDWAVGFLATLISFAVYLWSTAPNVTLLDSGEFVVAAEHFGVAHPTGYPLWTILSWLFQLLPLGNAAWEIALFSGVCTALAVGLGGMLLCSMQRWAIGPMSNPRFRSIPFFVALAFSLMLAFSESVWTQAVIAEVYGLHALLVAILLVLLYAWIRNPASDRLMLGAFFVLALAFSNHHLTLVLAPLPFLLILLLRREAFTDWLAAAVTTSLLAYFGLAYISQDQAIIKTAVRFLYCVVLALGLFVWLRKGRVQWRLMVLLPAAIALGLLPYAYMPFASSTNPPMNWSYARDLEGFFFSINRSQYQGSLTDQSLRTLGKLMGTSSQTREKVSRQNSLFTEESKFQEAQLWIGFFWQQLFAAFTIFSLLGYFVSILFILRKPLPQRTWIYCLHIAFALAAFLQPLMDSASIDNDGWWLQMPYHTYTNLIFAMLSGLGTGMLLTQLAEKRAIIFWVSPFLLILPIFTFFKTEPVASQRDRWFGWMYGHDMLKDLPQGTIVIGGTDPGRFVPTYMIFSESQLPARFKKDPTFDRRDLYIITQNALGEPNYMKYLRDHYTDQRPPVKNDFERWLKRDETYPAKPIILPSEEEVKEIGKKAIASGLDTAEAIRTDEQDIVFGAILKWIWEKNREEHEFVIEESFPIKWTYDYAIPRGLVYQLSKTKLDEIPPEAVKKDFEFWNAYIKKLLDNPRYAQDYDAKRSFSKLRLSLANIYRHRKMKKEAELAYRQALALWPANAAAILGIAPYAWERGEFQEVSDLFEKAVQEDPNSLELIRLMAVIEQRNLLEKEVDDFKKKSPAKIPIDLLRELLTIYSMTEETNRADLLVEEFLTKAPDDTGLLQAVAQHYSKLNEPKKALTPALRLAELKPNDGMSLFILARIQFQNGQTNEFYETARKLIQSEGLKGRESIKADDIYAPIRETEEFKKLVTPPSEAMPEAAVPTSTPSAQ